MDTFYSLVSDGVYFNKKIRWGRLSSLGKVLSSLSCDAVVKTATVCAFYSNCIFNYCAFMVVCDWLVFTVYGCV